MKASVSRRSRRIQGTIVLLLALPVVPARLAGQQDADAHEALTMAPVPRAEYVSDGRRDPFVPLTGTHVSSQDGEPRLEQLDLTGIFVGAPGNSLVVLEDAARRGHFVRVGETLGNARLLAILDDAAVFEIDDYGIVRRDTLHLLPDSSPAPRPTERNPEDGDPEPEEGT